MNLPKELLEKFKMLLQQLFIKHAQTDTPEAQGNDVYLQLASDEDERHDIEDLCDEIDMYHQERSNFKSSGKKAYQWFEQRAIDLYLQEHPNASEEEQQTYLSELRGNLDKVLLGNASIFSEEAATESFDDEAVEENAKKTEQQLLEGNDIAINSDPRNIQREEEER